MRGCGSLININPSDTYMTQKMTFVSYACLLWRKFFTAIHNWRTAGEKNCIWHTWVQLIPRSAWPIPDKWILITGVWIKIDWVHLSKLAAAAKQSNSRSIAEILPTSGENWGFFASLFLLVFYGGWRKIRKRLAKNWQKPAKDWSKNTFFPKVYKISTNNALYTRLMEFKVEIWL